jgi:hypothetical protein
VVRRAKHRSRRPRVTVHWREAGQGARRVAAAELPASPGTATLPPWHGRRIKIEDLAGFAAQWGLVAVGSDWPEGEPCPSVQAAILHTIRELGEAPSTTNIARYLGQDVASVSHDLADLLPAGKVVKGPRDGRVVPYLLVGHPPQLPVEQDN